MSIDSISSPSFRANQDYSTLLERPGRYATLTQEEDIVDISSQKKEKKSSFGKKLLKTVAGLAVVAAGLVALKKFDVVKVLPKENFGNAKWTEKVSHYLAKAGENIAKYTYDPIVALFQKAPKLEAATSPATENATATV